MNELIVIEGLSVHAGPECLVENLSLTVRRKECLTILGETGAGKSILAQAVMGLLPAGLVQSGRVLVNGVDIAGLGDQALQKMWGRQVTMLPQEPWHSLDPLMKGGEQVSEVYRYVVGQDWARARQRAGEDLTGVGLGGDADKLPGELSGGMAQRLAFCAATAGGAEIVLADEPTKGLDASKRDYIAALLRRKAETGCVLAITHDIDVARQLGGTVIVMKEGRVVEQGASEELLRAPRSEYGRALIQAAPSNWPDRPSAASPRSAHVAPVIQARGIAKTRGGKRLFDGLDLDVFPGEIVGITGDSGCGKSTLGDILLGLLPPDAGTVIRGAGHAPHKFLKLYQDPPAAFAPGIPLGRLFRDLMKLHAVEEGRLTELLAQLRLNPRLLERPVAEVSGGELQRLAIARALLLEPVFLFADEPVSRLDPITAREIVALLVDVAARYHCAVLLVSHDPELIGKVCHTTLRIG